MQETISQRSRLILTLDLSLQHALSDIKQTSQHVLCKPEVSAHKDPSGVIADKSVMLRAFGFVCWWSFIFFLVSRVDRSFQVELLRSDFPSSVLPSKYRSLLAQYWPVRWIDDVEITLNPTQPFAYISNSQALSGKNLSRFKAIYIRPTGLPKVFATDLYWRTAGGSLWIDELRTVLNAVFPGQWANELNDLESSIKPSNPSITAISSIYNGDKFLTGFLENASSWDKYESCEHLLIRAGSEGQEHDALIKHVDNFPNAVYINLTEDPGLYPVWNLGVQLSTAPYLTNANIDDRRAPQQVSFLTNFLDQQPDTSAVSTKLRVTNTANMRWNDSANCSVMFAHEPEGSYTVERLFRYETNTAVSRNLPHCMPIWRRCLHNYVGFFKEERYGPSADWEFWLRAGRLGAQYDFLDEPMGLYLQHEESYWHRGEMSDFDLRIDDEYALFARYGVKFDRAEYPLSQRINETLSARSADDALAVFSGLVDCVLRINEAGTSENACILIDKIAERCISFGDFCTFMDEHQSVFMNMSDPVENALTLAIELLHSDEFRPEKTQQGLLERVLVDHFLLTRSVTALLGLAFLNRQMGYIESENTLLRLASKLNLKEFWASMARVYRFKADLNEVTARLTKMIRRSDFELKDPSKLKIWFYPVYSSNKYTRLLYQDIVEQGAFVEGITDLAQFAQITPDADYKNVIHLHWVNEFVEAVNGSFPQEKGEELLAQLQRLRGSGFEIRWTVHNRLSHQSVNESKELQFRESMYNLADRVYLHHPMALSLVDWVTDNGQKCSLVEHGNYLSLFGTKGNRSDARTQLGFAQDDFIVLYIGLLRDYKGLNEFLPTIKRISSRCPRFKFVVAGRIDSERVKQLLGAMQSPNIFVHGAYLSDDEISLYTSAADMGFLSYRSILTSGTLFHLLSGGLPVVGPAIGTIPAYISKGWNGYVYEDSKDLEDIFCHCCHLPSAQVQKMGRNALTLAKALKWKYY